MDISVEATVNAPMERVWEAWTTPDDIRQWNFASDDWRCPAASLDFTVGGKFNYRMEATDGSMGFDLEGEFTAIDVNHYIRYVLADNRNVSVTFAETNQGIRIVETFEAENELPVQHQRDGWQSILNNFKKHVESAR